MLKKYIISVLILWFLSVPICGVIFSQDLELQEAEITSENLETEELKNQETEELKNQETEEIEDLETQEPETQITQQTQPLSFPEAPTLHNLLRNSSFESFSEGTDKAPDAWNVSKLKVSRDKNNQKFDSYAVKLTYKRREGSLSQAISEVNNLKGKTLTLGCWVKASVSNQVRISLDDGVAISSSDYHSGSGDFEFLNITTTISDSTTDLKVGIDLDAKGTAYVDGSCLYELITEASYIPNPQDDLKMPSNLIYTDLENQKVGIGVIPDTKEDHRLEVEGNIKASGSIFSGDNELLTQISADEIYINDQPSTGEETLTGNLNITGNLIVDTYLQTNGNIQANKFLLSDGTELKSSQWVTSGSDIYYNAGNVGIGIPTPNNTLQVASLINFDNARYSTFLGYEAGKVNSALANTFIGYSAGNSNTTGHTNTFLGFYAGSSNTTGHTNTFLGNTAGSSNTTGAYNTFLGVLAGRSNTTGAYNTFLGNYAGYSNTTGYYNTFLGNYAGYSNTTGQQNTFLGNYAGRSNTTGYINTFLGNYAGSSNTTGDYNTFLGKDAGYSNTEGSSNVFIGNRAGYEETGSNKLYIANSSGTPLIYGDFSAGKVGIATTTLDEALQVNGNIKATKFLGDGSGLTNLPITSLWSQSGSNIYYNSGNVGIGTTTPGNLLDLSNAAPIIRFNDTDGTSDNRIWRISANGGFSIRGDNDDGTGDVAAYSIDRTASANWIKDHTWFTTPGGVYDAKMILTQAGNVGIGTTVPTQRLQVNDTATSAFVVTSAGQVGIGTTSPGAKLDVQYEGASGLRLQGTWSSILMEAQGGYSRIYLDDLSSAYGNQIIFRDNGADLGRIGTNGGNIYISNSNGTSKWFTVNATAGNVGIGTTDPGAYKLKVAGSLDATTITQNGTAVLTSSTLPSNIMLEGENISLLNNNAGYITNGNTGWENNYGFITSGSTLTGLVQSTASGTTYFTGGKVGIGTTSPELKLHVHENQTWGGAMVFSNNNTDARWEVGIPGYANSSEFHIYDRDQSASRLWINDTGYVGIGTTSSPTQKLDVAGYVRGATGLCIGNDCRTSWPSGGGGDGIDGSGSTNYLTRWSDSDTVTNSIVYDNGKVGIGTISPTQLLTLSSSSVTSFSVRSTATGVNFNVFGVDPSDGAYIFWEVDGPLRFCTATNDSGSGWSEKLRITSSGNVGIGTTDPQGYKLYVNGDAFVSGNIAAKYQDVAEWVVSSQRLLPATVVSLDPNNLNQVIAAKIAYDSKVAGVVSEQPGLILGEAGENKLKVAHSGRVKVKATAKYGKIEIGDLLVASDIAGVAMKSKPIDFAGAEIHQPGTILGKALGPLEEGEGEILVLLSLQ